MRCGCGWLEVLETVWIWLVGGSKCGVNVVGEMY